MARSPQQTIPFGDRPLGRVTGSDVFMTREHYQFLFRLAAAVTEAQAAFEEALREIRLLRVEIATLQASLKE